MTIGNCNPELKDSGKIRFVAGFRNCGVLTWSGSVADIECCRGCPEGRCVRDAIGVSAEAWQVAPDECQQRLVRCVRQTFDMRECLIACFGVIEFRLCLLEDCSELVRFARRRRFNGGCQIV